MQSSSFKRTDSVTAGRIPIPESLFLQSKALPGLLMLLISHPRALGGLRPKV